MGALNSLITKYTGHCQRRHHEGLLLLDAVLMAVGFMKQCTSKAYNMTYIGVANTPWLFWNRSPGNECCDG